MKDLLNNEAHHAFIRKKTESERRSLAQKLRWAKVRRTQPKRITQNGVKYIREDIVLKMVEGRQ